MCNLEALGPAAHSDGETPSHIALGAGLLITICQITERLSSPVPNTHTLLSQ